MKSNLLVYCFLLIALTLTSCRSSKSPKSDNQDDMPQMVASPQVIIYKTKGEYFLHVPVTLSEDKRSLLSYPAPTDLFFEGDLAYPVKLENGYLLDRRGINPGSAFLKLTYYEYSRLEKTPAPSDLMNMLLDNDPFTVMYQCGPKHNYKDLINELNAIITEGKEENFKRLK